MKNWNELTVYELGKLTDEEIENIKIQIAIKDNIAIPIEPGDIPNCPVEKDVTVYSVDFLWDVYFTNESEAHKIADLLNSSKSIKQANYISDIKTITNTPKNYNGNNNYYKITKSQEYSEDTYQKNKDVINKYTDDINNYYRKERLYNKALYNFNACCRPFIDAVNKAKKHINKLNDLSKLFWKHYYVPASKISDYQNFIKVYDINEDDMQYIWDCKDLLN